MNGSETETEELIAQADPAKLTTGQTPDGACRVERSLSADSSSETQAREQSTEISSTAVDGQSLRSVKVPSVHRAPVRRHRRFILLEKWEGTVIDVDSETFTGRIFSSHEPNVAKQAVFDFEELSEEERAEVEIGAAFVWLIGFDHVGTTRYRRSYPYFRRLARWTQKELEQGAAKASDIAKEIGWT